MQENTDPKNSECGQLLRSAEDYQNKENIQIELVAALLLLQLVTHGADRISALNTMDQALDSYVIRGLAHNISLLRDICDNKRFREGNITTAFLNEEYPEGFSGMPFLC